MSNSIGPSGFNYVSFSEIMSHQKKLQKTESEEINKGEALSTLRPKSAIPLSSQRKEMALKEARTKLAYFQEAKKSKPSHEVSAVSKEISDNGDNIRALKQRMGKIQSSIDNQSNNNCRKVVINTSHKKGIRESFPKLLNSLNRTFTNSTILRESEHLLKSNPRNKNSIKREITDVRQQLANHRQAVKTLDALLHPTILASLDMPFKYELIGVLEREIEKLDTRTSRVRNSLQHFNSSESQREERAMNEGIKQQEEFVKKLSESKSQFHEVMFNYKDYQAAFPKGSDGRYQERILTLRTELVSSLQYVPKSEKKEISKKLEALSTLEVKLIHLFQSWGESTKVLEQSIPEDFSRVSLNSMASEIKKAENDKVRLAKRKEAGFSLIVDDVEKELLQLMGLVII